MFVACLHHTNVCCMSRDPIHLHCRIVEDLNKCKQNYSYSIEKKSIQRFLYILNDFEIIENHAGMLFWVREVAKKFCTHKKCMNVDIIIISIQMDN